LKVFIFFKFQVTQNVAEDVKLPLMEVGKTKAEKKSNFMWKYFCKVYILTKPAVQSSALSLGVWHVDRLLS
jgi:hypothetical protein